MNDRHPHCFWLVTQEGGFARAAGRLDMLAPTIRVRVHEAARGQVARIAAGLSDGISSPHHPLVTQVVAAARPRRHVARLRSGCVATGRLDGAWHLSIDKIPMATGGLHHPGFAVGQMAIGTRCGQGQMQHLPLQRRIGDLGHQ